MKTAIIIKSARYSIHRMTKFEKVAYTAGCIVGTSKRIVRASGSIIKEDYLDLVTVLKNF
jgi:hypothetical protein